MRVLCLLVLASLSAGLKTESKEVFSVPITKEGYVSWSVYTRWAPRTISLDNYTGQGRYVTVFDENFVQEVGDVLGATLIGAEGEATTYELVPTVRIVADYVSYRILTTTITLAPSVMISVQTEPRVKDWPVSLLSYSRVSCDITSSTNAVCLDTARRYGYVRTSTITPTEVGYQTFQLVETVTGIPEATPATARTTPSASLPVVTGSVLGESVSVTRTIVPVTSSTRVESALSTSTNSGSRAGLVGLWRILGIVTVLATCL